MNLRMFQRLSSWMLGSSNLFISPRTMNTSMDLSGYAHGVYYLGVVSNKGSEFVLFNSND